LERPAGVTHETFDDYVTFFTDLETECAHEIITQTTSFEPGTATETVTYTTLVSTFTGNDDIVTTETIYVVQTPDSRSHTATSTTIYTEGTGSIIATYSTGTGVCTGTDGIITTETTYYVEKPGPETTLTTALTTTLYSTNVKPTTETNVTTFTTTTDDDGDEEEILQTEIQEIMVPTIGINIGIFQSTTQYLSIFTPTIVTQVTTNISTDEDGEEEEVVETDVDLELSSVEDTITTMSTILTEGDITQTTTIATVVTIYYTTDSEGNEEEVIETDYVVEIHNVSETLLTATTEYINYSGSVTSILTHITTYFTTYSIGNKEEVIETDIIVESPNPAESVIDTEDLELETIAEEKKEEVAFSSSTIFNYYTGSVTSTCSAGVRTYNTTDVNGNEEEAIETYYYVDIP